MAKLQMKSMFERNKILPLVMTLANSILKELGLVKKINETVKWDRTHWEVSPGDLAKVLVLSTFFDVRTPLTHLADRFEGIDVEFFLSNDSKSNYVNSFNAGRALERIGEIDLATLKLSEEEQKELLQIERGYNKDGRPQCNQVVVGQIVTEDGIPIISKMLDGSTSDIDWNAEAVSYLKKLQTTGFRYGIFVADSKLGTHDLVVSMSDPKSWISFVSRCAANFEGKLESRMIQMVCNSGQWTEMGTFHDAKSASVYRGQSFVEEVCDRKMRLLVLESSSLKEKAVHALKKAQEAIQPYQKALEKKKFLCLADAEEEVKRFHSLPCQKLFECNWEIKKETVEK